MFESIVQQLLSKLVNDNINGYKPDPKHVGFQMPSFLLGKNYVGDNTMTGVQSPYQLHKAMSSYIKTPQTPSNPLQAEAASNAFIPSTPSSTGMVKGGGLPKPAVKKSIPTTGQFAGNDQTSMFDASPTLAGLPGELAQPSMSDLPEQAPLDATNLDGNATLPGGASGSQFSVPNNNLLKTLLSRLV